MYHVNNATGEAGKCSATKGKCPFGGPNVHYTTEEAARYAYEQTMSNAAPVVQKKAAPAASTGDGRTKRHSWPDLELYRSLISSGDEVFVHPQGKIAIVADGWRLRVFKAGKKATTSGSIGDLRAGRGAWRLVKGERDQLPAADAYAQNYANTDNAPAPTSAVSLATVGPSAREQANVAAGFPANSKLDATRAGEFVQAHPRTASPYRGGRNDEYAILPVNENANPHKDIGDKSKYWLNDGWKSPNSPAPHFEVWKSPRESGKGFNYKYVTTSGSITTIGSTSRFAHDQTQARMGDVWTMVGAFSAEDGGAAVGEVPDRSAPLYTYK